MLPPPHRLLIAGTGYGVGKTLVLQAIARSTLLRSPVPWLQIKLHQPAIGTLDLGETWRSLNPPLNSANPADEPQTGILIEAMGSLGTPVTPETTVADLAADWRLPTLLVGAVTEQGLDNLVAQVALAQQRRCDLRGIVLNCLTAEAEARLLDWSHPRQVMALTHVPVIGQVPFLGAELDLNATPPLGLAQIVANFDLALPCIKLVP